VVADIPGLIEGAHQGAGLGDRFLRHLERTRVLIHLLEVSAIPGRTPLRDYQTLRKELALYDADLASRPEIVALNKMDLPDVHTRVARLRATFARRKITLHAISTVTGEGIPALLEAAWKKLISSKPRRQDHHP